MKWLKIFSRRPSVNGGSYEEANSDEILLADEKLHEVKEKLAETRAQSKSLAKAAASARRVQYKVDKFTAEINRSFRGVQS